MSGRDRPWLMRTYSGHSSARASNALYRRNIAAGQTGLSVAFDLPTQTGYDADHELAAGEVGKVGVPISHIEDMEALFEDIDLATTNTSMTINATAPWLLALYIAVAERRGIDPKQLSGTTQNDIVKEYLSRGTYIFPPAPSLRLTRDLVTYTVDHVPAWNPINVCSYHLQEAGATPVQEVAYAMAVASAVLDEVRDSGSVDEETFARVVGRFSFFVNAGIRFVEEMCKMRAFVSLWDDMTRERYGVTDPKLRRFRYGVQVNSLGLTEAQPENNVQRIVLEMLAVTLSKDARARAIQLPAWNEALGLPRPADQQWALRMQQVLALETDLLEYPDLFDGSHVVEKRVGEICAEATELMADIESRGGMVAAVESGHVKRELVASHARRLRAIERGDLKVVGINCHTQTGESPLADGESASILEVDASVEQEQVERLRAFRLGRDELAVRRALDALEQAARDGDNIMPPSIACAHAGVTTGEWGERLRRCFGEYRAPTGVDVTVSETGDTDALAALRERAAAVDTMLGRPPRIVMAKPGLDGHSNGAEQIAMKCRDIGFEVVYEGIRMTPERIARTVEQEGAHLLGISLLSGSHQALVTKLMDELRARGQGDVPVVVGGIIPDADAEALRQAGIAAVYTPKDADLNVIAGELLDLIARSHNSLPAAARW